MLCQKTCDVPFGMTAIVSAPEFVARRVQLTETTIEIPTKGTKRRARKTRNRFFFVGFVGCGFRVFRELVMLSLPDSRTAAPCRPARHRARAPADRRHNPS